MEVRRDFSHITFPAVPEDLTPIDGLMVKEPPLGEQISLAQLRRLGVVTENQRDESYVEA
jgi:hypothetical protein